MNECLFDKFSYFTMCHQILAILPSLCNLCLNRTQQHLVIWTFMQLHQKCTKLILEQPTTVLHSFSQTHTHKIGLIRFIIRTFLAIISTFLSFFLGIFQPVRPTGEIYRSKSIHCSQLNSVIPRILKAPVHLLLWLPEL